MGTTSTATGRRRATGPAGGTFDSLEQEAYLQLWRTYDRLREIDERVFARHAISAQQYNALRVLRSVHPAGLATAALGGRLVSRAPDMTRLLDKLEERGLVRRRRRADNRRVVEAWITPAGATLVTRLAEDVRRCGREQLGHLDRKTLRTLVDILERARQPHEDAAGEAAWPAASG
jgi:DNA-binding MarR family transcriptional regulator